MPHNDVNWRTACYNPEDVLPYCPINVTIVGTGALGAQICLELTRYSPVLIAGVTLIDQDILEAGNVPSGSAWHKIVTQFGKQVIGNYKSELLAHYCQLQAPHIRWTSRACEIADVGWGDLRDADIIVTCTDSVLSRMETAYAARMLDKPMLDAGVLGSGYIGGRVAYYAPHPAAACYSCGLSMATRAAVLEYLASASFSCPTIPLIEAIGSSHEGFASVDVIAQLVVHQLHQDVSREHSYAWRATRTAVETLRLSKSAECPWHHHADLIALDDDRSIREALWQDDVLLLPWAIALTAVCDGCGTPHDTPVRIAKLRHNNACSVCGASSLRAERVVERIVVEDDLAERTPSQLGLPKRNVFPVRKRIQTQRTF